MNHFRDGMLTFVYLLGMLSTGIVMYDAGEAWYLIIPASVGWPIFIPMMLIEYLKGVV